jgi:hypothetical protein
MFREPNAFPVLTVQFFWFPHFPVPVEHAILALRLDPHNSGIVGAFGRDHRRIGVLRAHQSHDWRSWDYYI